MRHNFYSKVANPQIFLNFVFGGGGLLMHLGEGYYGRIVLKLTKFCSRGGFEFPHNFMLGSSFVYGI